MGAPAVRAGLQPEASARGPAPRPVPPGSRLRGVGFASPNGRCGACPEAIFEESLRTSEEPTGAATSPTGARLRPALAHQGRDGWPEAAPRQTRLRAASRAAGSGGCCVPGCPGSQRRTNRKRSRAVEGSRARGKVEREPVAGLCPNPPSLRSSEQSTEALRTLWAG